MTQHPLRLAVLLAAAVLPAPATLAQEAKPTSKPAAAVLATVNGVAIPKTRAEMLFNEQKAQGAPDNLELHAMVREELIRREILTQEAVKKGLVKKPEIVNQIELARQALLIRAYLQDYSKAHPISEADIRKEYDGITQSMGDKEYKSRHILVEKEGDAKDIIAKLQKSEKFEELAKQSKDLGSKDRGGDLGWIHPSGYVKPFADALKALEKGKFSAEPVKTEFGYHVILLEDTRPLKHPALDELKLQIQQRLQQQLIEKHILELRAKAKVE